MKESALQKLRENERQNRANHILNAAKTVFIIKGYKNATVRDIAKEAELTTGAIYAYFKNKDTMYGEVCRLVFLDLYQHLESTLFSKSGTMLDRLKNLFSAYIEYDDEYENDTALLAIDYRQLKIDKTLSEELSNLLSRVLDYTNLIITDGIKNGDLPETVNSKQYALTLWATVEGFLYLNGYGIVDHKKLKVKNLVNDFLESFYRGHQ
ncbi:MAG: TetR/AcrR family transcriptional regulator [Desulfobacterales bacterium]|nr:TetR/AcrR family transcriptional regulator [Desulfobacterales bacterium]